MHTLFSSIVKFKFLTLFPVDHLSFPFLLGLVLLLCWLTATAYYVISSLSFSPHYLHLLFCFVLSISLLVLMTLFCAALRRNSISNIRFPFRFLIQALSCEISPVSRLKCPCSHFYSHFCFLQNGWRRSYTAITQECCEQYWTSPGGNTPQSTNYTAICLLSRKLSKVDEPDMRALLEKQGRAHKWCTPTYGRANAGRPPRTYIQQLCEDTGCSPEDLQEVMNDRETWRERVRYICASDATWWWWWWWVILGYLMPITAIHIKKIHTIWFLLVLFYVI